MFIFDVVSLIEKSTSFPLTCFGVISIVENSTFFPNIFFSLISMVEKSTLFPRIFLDVISLVEISMFFPGAFFNVISLVEKSMLFPLTFLDKILMGKSSTSFLVKSQAYKNIRESFSFVSNFKKLTFARLFSLNFSSKSTWCSSVPLTFEPYSFQLCEKNCRKLVFWVFTEQLLYHKIFSNYIAMKLL